MKIKMPMSIDLPRLTVIAKNAAFHWRYSRYASDVEIITIFAISQYNHSSTNVSMARSTFKLFVEKIKETKTPISGDLYRTKCGARSFSRKMESEMENVNKASIEFETVIIFIKIKSHGQKFDKWVKIFVFIFTSWRWNGKFQGTNMLRVAVLQGSKSI